MSAASRIIVPLVTPFDRGGEVDGGALGRLVDHAIAEGADALMTTALTGEGPSREQDLLPQEPAELSRVLSGIP